MARKPAKKNFTRRDKQVYKKGLADGRKEAISNLENLTPIQADIYRIGYLNGEFDNQKVTQAHIKANNHLFEIVKETDKADIGHIRVPTDLVWICLSAFKKLDQTEHYRLIKNLLNDDKKVKEFRRKGSQ